MRILFAKLLVGFTGLMIVALTVLFAVIRNSSEGTAVAPATSDASSDATSQDPQAATAARTAGPRGAQVSLAGTGETVEVTVRARLRPVGGWLGRLAEVQVQGQAVARREQSLTAP